MSWLRDLSLKIKLILLLVILTGSMLVTFGYLAIQDFEKDKQAYVRDFSRGNTRSASLQIKAELSYLIERLNFFMRGFETGTHSFHSFAKSSFSSETKIDILAAFFPDSATGNYLSGDVINKENISAEELEKFKQSSQLIFNPTLKNEIAVQMLPDGNRVLLGLRFERKEGAPLIIVASLSDVYFLDVFSGQQMQDTYLVNESASPLLYPKKPTYKLADTAIKEALIGAHLNIKSPEGSYLFSKKKSQPIIVTVASVGIGNLKIMSLIPMKVALEAVRKVKIKSALFLGLLFFVTVIISVFASATITASLKQLLQATQEIAKGNFSFTLRAQSRDEVGTLTLGFNRMAQEIHRLVKETAEKARMEVELRTAQVVQSTLFPKDYYVGDGFEVRGFYEPASECSGDWWFHTKLRNKTIFCIGDATGHGVPAALLTAAARSTASSFEVYPDLTVSEMMNIFNRAIYNTARGQFMMTFVLACLDHDTNILTYANASHEPPFLIPNKDTLAKDDFRCLDEVRGPRLGENSDSLYREAALQLNPGEMIIFYTDGMTELKNAKGEMWGERKLIRSLIKLKNQKKDTKQIMSQLALDLSTFRQATPLKDDVTYFLLTRTS